MACGLPILPKATTAAEQTARSLSVMLFMSASITCTGGVENRSSVRPNSPRADDSCATHVGFFIVQEWDQNINGAGITYFPREEMANRRTVELLSVRALMSGATAWTSPTPPNPSAA